MQTTDPKLKYWLALNRIPDFGPVTIKKLWEHFGDVEKVWHLVPEELAGIEGLNRKAINSFLTNRGEIDLDDELAVVKHCDVQVLTLTDPDYPPLLKEIYDPPPVIYLKGQPLSSQGKTIAIVGTREASQYGKDTARRLAQELASLGFTIVSGLASGIDTAAHWGALEGKGKTWAVFGCGVDKIYPAQNRELARAIENSGTLVSEFPLGMGTDKGHFPRRNRIISGLSLGVIVVEGHYDSGALITAKAALDQGREVFAVPGEIGAERTKGPHWLIKQGAKLVESVDDVLEEFNMERTVSLPKSEPILELKPDYSLLTDDESKIINVLSRQPKHIDSIANETDFSISQLASLLLTLEIKKLIRSQPGKFFVLY